MITRVASLAAAAAALRAPPRRVSPRAAALASATVADWRAACADGVVSYYDAGVRVGAPAPAGGGAAYAAREGAKYVGATAAQYALLAGALSLVDGAPRAVPRPAVWLLFAFLSLRSRVVSLLDNSRPNREAQAGKATPPEVKRPAWTPPGIAFPFIWLTITGLRATAAATAYRGALRTPAHDALLLHLCIGDTWNCVTNIEKRLGVSAVGCLAVWGSVLRAVVAFRASPAPVAGLVLAPSLAWISVACVLTASIWSLNGRPPLYPARADGASAPLRLKYLLQLEATSIRGGA